MQMFVGVEPLASLSLSMRIRQEAGEAFKSRGKNKMIFGATSTMEKRLNLSTYLPTYHFQMCCFSKWKYTLFLYIYIYILVILLISEI